MSIDHEEICLCYGIKHNRQCARCKAPYPSLHAITETFAPRTEADTREMLAEQEAGSLPRTDHQWVHDVKPFFWNHPISDMHENVAVDMLHGLQKGVFRNLVDMTCELIQDLYPGQRATKARTKRDRLYSQSPGIIRLDARFKAVPNYQELKHFKSFSNVTQWTGGEERSLIRVWITVVTPLLIEKAPMALAYSRALVDFILIAQGRTHSDDTLDYLRAALVRIDALKGAFDKYRPQVEGQASWNTPKFHMLSHYVEVIELFGAPNGMDTEFFEVDHKILLKDFYDLTNKNDDYLTQLARHNTKDVKIKAMLHFLMTDQTTTSSIDGPVIVHATEIVKTPAHPSEYGCPQLDYSERLQIRQYYHPDYRGSHVTTAGILAEALQLPGFMEAVGCFINEQRNRRLGIETPYDYSHACHGDWSWVRNIPIILYKGIRCWKRSGKDDSDSEAMRKEHLRCTPAWRMLGPRNDYCWVQAWPRTQRDRASRSNNPHNGSRVGQLRLILSVLDTGFPREDYSAHLPSYRGAMIDVYPFVNETANPAAWTKQTGEPHPIHGMIEVSNPKISTAVNPHRLYDRRIFRLVDIYRSAHVVPSKVHDVQRQSDVSYVNNYIDWDEYQTRVAVDWAARDLKQARAMKAQFEQQNRV